jgi:hypothetical protein
MLETQKVAGPVQALVSTEMPVINQTQREAIVDLMLLGMHVDRHISLSEADFLEAEMGFWGWDEFYSPEIYLQRAVPIVRAVDDRLKQTGFLQDVRDRLEDVESRKFAVERFSMMLAIDGTVQVEETLLDRVMQVFFGQD